MDTIKISKRITIPANILKEIKQELGLEEVRVDIKNHLNLLSFHFSKEGYYAVRGNTVTIHRFIQNYFSNKKESMEHQPFQMHDKTTLVLALTGNKVPEYDLKNFGPIFRPRKGQVKRNPEKEIIIRPDGRVCLPKTIDAPKCWAYGDETKLTLTFKQPLDEEVVDKKGHPIESNGMIYLHSFFKKLNLLPEQSYSRGFLKDKTGDLVIYLKGSTDFFLTEEI